jgi:hypothetical protein
MRLFSFLIRIHGRPTGHPGRLLGNLGTEISKMIEFPSMERQARLGGAWDMEMNGGRTSMVMKRPVTLAGSGDNGTQVSPPATREDARSVSICPWSVERSRSRSAERTARISSGAVDGERSLSSRRRTTMSMSSPTPAA